MSQPLLSNVKTFRTGILKLSQLFFYKQGVTFQGTFRRLDLWIYICKTVFLFHNPHTVGAGYFYRV